MDSRNRGVSRAPTPGTIAGASGGAGPSPSPGATAMQGSFWTHHEIDYSWRFPYPEQQPKEFYDARVYVDEERRRRPQRGGGGGGAAGGRPDAQPLEAWRSRERMRTQCAALVACLNIGVDPPDVVRPSPCARMECWIDPESMLPAKALKAIGGRLQLQYERWHEKARYKTLLDPTAEELRKALISLRRQAAEERVLLHYNGHGVPRPTGNGEVWVYNKGFTQYIPVSLYDLQTWMGGVQAPTAYVFDCSNAGIIVDAFQHFIKQRRDKLEAKIKMAQQQHAPKQQQHNMMHQAAASSGDESSDGGLGPNSSGGGAAGDEAALASLHDPCRHILLAACGANESLPFNPDLPADLFTSCLTTPIKMALRWFVSRSLLNTHSSSASGVASAAGGGQGGFVHAADLAASMASATASGVLPPPPAPTSGSAAAASAAAAPPTNRQRLYELIDKLPGIRKPSNRKSPYGELNWIFTAITDSIAWNILPRPLFHKLFRQDLLISSLFRNFLLAQRILASYHCTVLSVPEIAPTHLHPLWSCWDLACDIALSQLERFERHGTPFTPSTFFEEQLTSFEIWLEFGSAAKPPPMQLPVVLQVLLSTDHRLRALQLLARFIDKGLWAINLALSVGIFPYVLKLLQSPSKELREVLVFLWAKVLALDRSVQADLSKIEYASYFIQHLNKFDAQQQASAANAAAANAAAAAAAVAGGVHGFARNLHAAPHHSRNSSSGVSPSPYLHAMQGGSSSASSTPFYGFAPAPYSNTSSAAATPLVHAMTAGDVMPQFPLRSFPPLANNANAAAAGGNTSPQQHQQQNQQNPYGLQLAQMGHRSSNPPPLDLPPSNDAGSGGSGGPTTAHLREHPQQSHLAHIHMRAQPLHDPAVALRLNNHDASAGTAGADGAAVHMEDEEKTSSHMYSSALPPVHPQQPSQQRVPFPLDLSAAPSTGATVSPLHSPTGGAGGGFSSAGPNSAKPSPQLSGIAFSPISPLLSPQVHGRGFSIASSSGGMATLGSERFAEERASGGGAGSHSLPDSMSDAHDLTRLAREILGTTSLQHLLSVFILSCIASGNPKGQQVLLQAGLNFRDLTVPHLLHSPDARLRRWSCLAIAKLWQGFGHAKSLAAQDQTPEQLCQLLMDPQPAVRCAALYALGLFFGGKTAPLTSSTTGGGAAGASAPGSNTSSPTHAQRQMHQQRASERLQLEVQLGAIMSTLINDGSPYVRRELMIALAELVYHQLDLFLSIATAPPRARESISPQGWHIWRAVVRGCRDCSQQVQEVSLAIKQYLKGRAILNQSQLGRMIGSQHQPGLQFGGVGGARNNYGYVHENINEDGEYDDQTTLSRRASNVSRDTSPSSTLRRAQPSNNAGQPGQSGGGEQSIAHIDHDDSTAAQGDDAGSTARDTTVQPQQQQMQPPPQMRGGGPPARIFNRFQLKGAHGRVPGVPGGLPTAPSSSSSSAQGPGGQRRSTDKSSIIKSMESPDVTGGAGGATASGGKDAAAGLAGAGPGTMDERAADAMWQVPKSRVFEESYAQFSEPMLLSAAAAAGVGADVSTAASVLVPSMSEIRHTKWRHARNQAVQSHARELIRAPSIKSSYVEVGYLNAEWEATSCLRFHPYETLLFAADNKSGIGVFNYSPDSASGASGGAERLNTFSNDNPPGTRVTQLELVNELAVSLLMVASDDGVVRVWRGAHEEGRQSLVTAWVANPQPEPFYSATAPTASNTTVPNTPASSTATVVDSYGVPSHGGEVSMSMAHTPAARLAGRAHTGVGMPPPPTSPGSGNIAMRHSVSTPAMALSANGATPAASTRNDSISRNGSVITQPNSYLSVPHAQTQRSPSLSGASSPALSGQAVSGAMNIPNLSLGGSANNTTGQQRVSPAQSFSGGWSSLSSRRKQKPPMTIEWQQQRGRLLASGNGLDSMRIWNVEQELCVSDIPLIGHEHSELSPAHATSIASDGGDIVWVGCADGSVRCFDLRLSPLESLVSSALLHRTPVHSVRLQRGGTDGGKLISASVGGDIALADVRASLAAVNTQEEAASASVVRFHRGSHKDKTSLLSAFAVHDYAPIMASGSPKPFIEVFAHDGATLNVMRHHIGFLGARVAPVSSLTFHRHHLVLAAGGADGTITLYDGGGGMGSGTQR